jgi:RNA polymerase sigma-70 factor (ECF subfamily)
MKVGTRPSPAKEGRAGEGGPVSYLGEGRLLAWRHWVGQAGNLALPGRLIQPHPLLRNGLWMNHPGGARGAWGPGGVGAMEEDQALLGAIAGGSKAAFQSYYERHAGRLLGYVLRVTRDRELAEDVVQDVFTAIWLKASSYRAEHGSPLAWMYMIARNKLVDRWRRRPPGEQPLEGEVERSMREVVGADPELSLGLERALAVLNPEQRQAVELAVLGGYTHEEGAVALAVPLGTFKSRVRMALLHLRALLTE